MTERQQQAEMILTRLDAFIEEIYQAWDSDQDSRVGKMLLSLGGHRPKYRADIDQFRADLKAALLRGETPGEQKDGAGLAAVDGVSVSVHAPELSHVESLRHVLSVASYHTCDLDHFATAMNVANGLEGGWLLLVSRANAEAALNDARVWGQWFESKGANSSEAKQLQTRARVMLGLDVGSGNQDTTAERAVDRAGAQAHASSSSNCHGETPEGSPSRWLPIESAPKDGRTIIGFDPNEPAGSIPVDGLYWHAEVACWIWADDGCEARPTHWMPMPDPPSRAQDTTTHPQLRTSGAALSAEEIERQRRLDSSGAI